MIWEPLCNCLNFNSIALPANHHGTRRDAEANEGLAVGGGEGNAPLGDGDEGSEGIMQWILLTLV
jgi:hypothetical protein